MLCRVYTNQHWPHSLPILLRGSSMERTHLGIAFWSHNVCVIVSRVPILCIGPSPRLPTHLPTLPSFFLSLIFSLSLPSWDHSRYTSKHRHCRKHLFTTPWTLYYGGLHLLCGSGGHLAVKLQLYGPCSCVFFPGPSLDNLPFPASYSLHRLPVWERCLLGSGIPSKGRSYKQISSA